MNVEPLPIPVKANSTTKQAKKPQKLPPCPLFGRNIRAPITARIMPMNTSWVTFAPLLILSAQMPPTGRANALTNGPTKAYFTGSISVNWLLVSSAKPAAKPKNEPNVPK